MLPIGGLKEKVLAAHRQGIRKFILPKKNEKDLMEIPKDVVRQMNFLFVDDMDEVVDNALACGPYASAGGPKAGRSGKGDAPASAASQVAVQPALG